MPQAPLFHATRVAAAIGFLLVQATVLGNANQPLQPKDVFQLEYATDPQISPDGTRIVYARISMDIMSDQRRSNLWIIGSDGSDHRPLTSGDKSAYAAAWSPDGGKLLYLSDADGSTQIYLRWMDTGQTARLAQLTESPRSLSWSPDGRWIAFSMLVKEEGDDFAELPSKPEGAKWAEPPKVIDRLVYRADGGGYLPQGYDQIFVLPAEGGSPRQVTDGPYDHGGRIAWAPDSKSILFAANRRPGNEYDPQNSELYRLNLESGTIVALTGRQGPDRYPVVSPSGKIAYLGFDDRYQGYQVQSLYLLDEAAGSGSRLTGNFDRDVESPVWSADSSGLYFQYDEDGNGKIAFVSLDGQVQDVAHNLGGTSFSRPYSGGQFSVSNNGVLAYTWSRPDRPSDLAVATRGKPSQRLTGLNEDLLAYRTLGEVEEIRFPSSFDGREVQGWIVKPPAFDPSQKYPLILEIHGGPFAAYGPHFSTEAQLYAAAGYVVLYANPRGSTSYGEEFGNLIHHNYPGEDYDDLMSGVDAVIGRGYVDPDLLYVTGGSGGGVLTAWIVGKTDRFRAAVVAKPVINWASFVLTSDAADYFYKYWFPGFPWEHMEHYWKRSPLSLAGNVKTPTMVLTGEADYRTPISESEQFYEALKLRKVDTVLVRVPGASHGIASRPSQLIAKVAYILEWFKRHQEE